MLLSLRPIIARDHVSSTSKALRPSTLATVLSSPLGSAHRRYSNIFTVVTFELLHDIFCTQNFEGKRLIMYTSIQRILTQRYESLYDDMKRTNTTTLVLLPAPTTRHFCLRGIGSKIIHWPIPSEHPNRRFMVNFRGPYVRGVQAQAQAAQVTCRCRVGYIHLIFDHGFISIRTYSIGKERIVKGFYLLFELFPC